MDIPRSGFVDSSSGNRIWQLGCSQYSGSDFFDVVNVFAELGGWRIDRTQQSNCLKRVVGFYQPERLGNIRIVGDDYCAIKNIKPCVIQNMHRQVYIGALFFRFINFGIALPVDRID